MPKSPSSGKKGSTRKVRFGITMERQISNPRAKEDNKSLSQTAREHHLARSASNKERSEKRRKRREGIYTSPTHPNIVINPHVRDTGYIIIHKPKNPEKYDLQNALKRYNETMAQRPAKKGGRKTRKNRFSK